MSTIKASASAEYRISSVPGLCLGLGGAGKSDEYASRQRDRARDVLLCLLHDVLQRTVADVEGHADAPLAAVVLDAVPILGDGDPRDLRKRHRAAGTRDHQARQLCGLMPQLIGQEQHHIDRAGTAEGLAHHGTRIGGVDGIEHVLSLETGRRHRLRLQARCRSPAFRSGA